MTQIDWMALILRMRPLFSEYEWGIMVRQVLREEVIRQYLRELEEETHA